MTYSRQSIQTHRDRLSVLRHFAAWMQAEHGITDPAQVEHRHVQQYVNLQAEARTGSGVLDVYKNLRVFFRHLAGAVKGCEQCLDRKTFRSHSCALTPVHGVRKPRPSEHKSEVVQVPSKEEWAAVLKAAGDGRTLKSAWDLAMLLLLADSGLRRAELQALNVGDVDLPTQVVLVRRGKGRVSVFGDQARLAVKRYLRLRADKYTDESPLWVSTRGGRRLSYVQLGKIMSDLGEAAGVGRIHPHQTRHLFVHVARSKGMPESALMTLGGWSGKIPST